MTATPAPYHPGREPEAPVKPKMLMVSQGLCDNVIWLAHQHAKSARQMVRWRGIEHDNLMGKPAWTWSSNRLMSRLPWVTDPALEAWSSIKATALIVAAIMDPGFDRALQGLYLSNLLGGVNLDGIVDGQLSLWGVDQTWEDDDLTARYVALYAYCDAWVAAGFPREVGHGFGAPAKLKGHVNH